LSYARSAAVRYAVAYRVDGPETTLTRCGCRPDDFLSPVSSTEGTGRPDVARRSV
jgi:hypothetical protein